MCFSVQASFLSGVLLLVIGAITVRSVHSSRAYPFAAIPFLFGLQQCAEGVVWLSFMYDMSPLLFISSVFLFLFFALCIWPVYIPYVFLRLEPFSPYKILMRILAWVGFVGALALFCMMLYYGVGVAQLENHIIYVVAAPWLQQSMVVCLLIPYALCTLLPFLVSSYVGIRWLGGAIFFSLLLTMWFWFEALTSVWCFFAALLSIGIAYCVIRYKL